jgi:hypothetical protein
MKYCNYQIELICYNNNAANNLYLGFAKEGWLEEERFSIFAPSYECEMDFDDASYSVDDKTLLLNGFSNYSCKEDIWNLFQALKEKSEDYDVDVYSYVIKIRGDEDYIFQDFYYPAPTAIAQKLKENLDLTDKETQKAYNEAINYIWGFEIEENILRDLVKQDEENITSGDFSKIDEILLNASCGNFGEVSFYIQIDSTGIVDCDTSLEYLQNSGKTLNNQINDYDKAVANAIANFNKAEETNLTQDKEKAFTSLNKICSATVSAEALYLLGMCYVREYGCEKDFTKSFELMEKAAQLNYPKAKWKLGLFYEGRGNVVGINYDKAQALYKEAADAGVVQAYRLLGRLYLKLGKIDQGKDYLRKAIANKDNKAQNILAAHYIQQVNASDEKIAITPHISPNNLKQVNLEYAIPYGIYDSSEELMANALALIGDTDPDGIKSGVLFTTRGIYSQQKGFFKKTQHSAKLTKRTQITLPDETLYVDAEEFFTFKKTSIEQIRKIIEAIKKYQQDLP